MRERGRAIPDTQTIPIIERQKYPPPKIVEGRVSVKDHINHSANWQMETAFQVQEEVFFEDLFLETTDRTNSLSMSFAERNFHSNEIYYKYFYVF